MITKGNNCKLKYPFKVTEFLEEKGIMRCVALITTTNENGGETKELFPFVLPISCPVFKLGPRPYTNFKIPGYPGDDSYAWVREDQRTIFDKMTQENFRLVLPEDFFFKGKFVLLPMSKAASPTSRYATRRKEHEVKKILKGLVGKTLPGTEVNGKVIDFIIKTDKSVIIHRTVEPKYIWNRIKTKKVEVLVNVEFEHYSEAVIPYELCDFTEKSKSRGSNQPKTESSNDE